MYVCMYVCMYVQQVAKAALGATSAFIVELGDEQEVMIMERVLTPMVCR